MMNWKGYEGNGHDLPVVLCSICLEELRKITKTSARIAGLEAEN
jgi:hypothetical protein